MLETERDTGVENFRTSEDVTDKIFSVNFIKNLTAFAKNSHDELTTLIASIPALTDGNKGDVAVSSSGAVWTINNSVVTLAKMADVATGTVFYRKTGGTGVPEVQSLATLKADLGLYNQTIEDEGTPVTQRGTINFTGAGVTVTDSDGKTIVTITSGGGGVDTANSPNANEFARFTDADTIEGRTVAETKADLSLDNVTNTSDANKPVSTAQQTALDLKANLASPALTGTPTAPTAAANTNTDQIATTAFVQQELTDLIGTAPSILDTLGEIADAINDDANLYTTLTSSIATKQPLDAELTALAGLTSAADKLPYFTGSGTAGLADLSSVARTLIAQTSQANMRSTGLGLGTISTQDASSVAITGGSAKFDNSGLSSSDTSGSFKMIYRCMDSLGADVQLRFATGGSTRTLTISNDVTLGDDTAYGVSWNGNVSPPSKNAVYDKIETLSAGTASMPAGHIYGLTMSNAADTANDITIAVGKARSEDDTTDITLASPITKRLDAAWAVGTNQGGLNTGAEANSTWYEVILIRRSDTGVVDVMFSTTANRATLPANYDSKRRIGWIRNDGSGNILQFTQVGDYITYTTPQNDVSATASVTATTRTVTVPPSCIGRMRVAALGNTSINAANGVVVSELVETDTAPTTTNGFLTVGSGDFAIMDAAHIELRVNSSSQIRDRSITATGSMAYDISTFGFIDDRLQLG